MLKNKLFWVLLAIGLVASVLNAVLKVALYIAVGVLVFIVGFWLLLMIFKIFRIFYHLVSPVAKQKYLDDELNRIAKMNSEKVAQVYEYERKTRNEARAEVDMAFRREKAVRDANEKAKAEYQRVCEHRDAETQDVVYTYQIGLHGNESLAIRYGIVNTCMQRKEAYFFAKGGIRTRNPERDTFFEAPSVKIRLRKVKKLSDVLFEVVLSDFRDRHAKAIIEPGQEYVKTFYPMDDIWFQKHANLELTLKGNGSFSLKELATFHVQKTF